MIDSAKILRFFITIFVLTTTIILLTEAGGKKGDLYILGGGGGCGPSLLYKTNGKNGKKGEMVIMNNCDSGSYKNDENEEVDGLRILGIDKVNLRAPELMLSMRSSSTSIMIMTTMPTTMAIHDRHVVFFFLTMSTNHNDVFFFLPPVFSNICPQPWPPCPPPPRINISPPSCLRASPRSKCKHSNSESVSNKTIDFIFKAIAE
ncbi:hypothetical protein SSS_00819 [Sarcoptes scabiei]|uniref:Transmembrane protein n=1 Tax=Sarcoptes scabiei TaxID=52283 RepID=A0A834VEF6_SARSC|nr:hypothetical protein SSS_00819 [Sarcoptes scabiei]